MSHHILVVDDDADIRETLVEILEESGHRAVSASNGNEALEVLRAAPDRPCPILLDLMMPGMDGRTFRAEQLKDPSLAPIPVVLLSAFRDTAETARELDVAGHLPKPVSLDALIKLVGVFC